MKSYADIKAQINQLEKEAEEVRRKELQEVISSIREKIQAYDLSPSDLGFKMGRGGMVKTMKKGAGIPKYRDPKSGKTWTGHGKPPNWIASAKNRDAFLIGGPEPVAEAAPKKARASKASAEKAAPKKAVGRKAPAKKAAAKKAEAAEAAA